MLKPSSQKNTDIEPTQGNEKWKVGPGHIELEDIVLLGLKQVSKVGLQPILCYFGRNA